MDLDIRLYLTRAKEEKDAAALRTAFSLIGEGTRDGLSKMPRFSPDLLVLCAEEALELGCSEISTACLKLYFEGKPPNNQFLCRAYLCQGQMKSPPATGSMEDFETALLYFLKAIEISKNNPRYHFMVFNASLVYFQTVRPLLRPGLRRHLVPSLTQVVRALEAVAEQDHSWRAELMMHLIECLVESGKMRDACSFAGVTAEFIEMHTPHLLPKIFKILVQHNLSESSCLRMAEQHATLAIIYKIQNLKSSMEKRREGELKEEDSTKLKEIFHLLVDCATGPHQSSTPIPPTDRVTLLLDLAFLALQLKHEQVASDCLTELKTAGEATLGQHVMMKCVQCELNLFKNEGKMNDYCKASVKARLKEIGKLDRCLERTVIEGEPWAVQAVCATQWNLALPLLQHNLRRHIKAELLRVAQALENTQSMLLETRCQVHSELAVIEEEEGRIEASAEHFQKAMLLSEGEHREHLSSAAHLLQLRQNHHQTTTRTEDKAAVLIQQVKDWQSQAVAESRPILVNVGLLLAPEAFQMMLDADSTSKSSHESGQVAQLSAKAQKHATSVQWVEGHLDRQGDDSNDMERVKLWAALAKIARKQEIWDVCSTACRFCLLYNDGRWKITKREKGECLDQESRVQSLYCHKWTWSSVRHLLRLLAEVCFINAEATIHKLRMEGVQLNSPAVPAESELCVSEDDPHWAVYRDWIQALSAYATSNFLQAAELGAEIGESWVVANTAVYLWNYNSHLLAAGEYRRLLPTFHRIVEMLRQTDYTGDLVLFVLLCDAVAQGLIQPPHGHDSSDATLQSDKAKTRAGRGVKQRGSLHRSPDAPQDICKALELCDHALHLSNGNIPGEDVPIAARKKVVSTWVQIKRLLEQQIGQKMDIDNECKNEPVSAMTRVLVGVEMLQCNSNSGHMEFSVPSLSTLVHMASDCSWSDAVVELQVWSQLAALCHHAKDHSLVISCTQNALQLETAATQRLQSMPCALYSPFAVNEMLSSVASLRGLSLVHESIAYPHNYREAMDMLLSSVRYAEKAENPQLCRAAARDFWNTCLPLAQTPVERGQLQEPFELILSALAHTRTKHKNKADKVKGLGALTSLVPGCPPIDALNEDDLTLQVGIYSLLFYIHVDKADWRSALQVLDKAIRDMPDTRHRLPLFKQRVLVRAQLGESILMDMKRFPDEGELCCSSMWHRIALCSKDMVQQLACYQNAISSLSSSESQWQKAELLLEFGEWLYCQNFPIPDAQHQIQWAIDILLHMNADFAEDAEKRRLKEGTDFEGFPRADQSQHGATSPVGCESQVAVQGVLFTSSLFKLREVRWLDSLVRAHTLLAVMVERTSPQHQLNLLRAYTFVLQMWQVSMVTTQEVFREQTRSQPTQPPPSTDSKTDKSTSKDKRDGKKAKEALPPPHSEEKGKGLFQDEVLPSTPGEWACYICPDEARQTFRTSTNPNCINTCSITKQAQSLFYLNFLAKELHSLSLGHLTLPILHLAETIAHDLMGRRGLSDLYRLRIVRTCCQLGMDQVSPYCEKLLHLSIVQEQEQMRCRKAILHKVLLRERTNPHMDPNQNSKMDRHVWSKCLSAQDIWLDKAEICLSMGLYQATRQLLAEAHLVATELGDLAAVARSLLALANLACAEQNHAQALTLLEKAQDLGGDEEFWYQLTLTMVTATVCQRDQDEHMKIDQIIEQGCAALKLVLEQQLNRAPQLKLLITSLKSRGAVECIHSLKGGQPRKTLPIQASQRLMAACDTLVECAGEFIKLGCREQAAEAHLECAQGLRNLSEHASRKEGKQRYLLDALSQMQQAVSVQEDEVLNAQSLLPPQESPGLTLRATRRLLRLRLSLAELCVAMLEQLCAEEKSHTLAQDRKASVDVALEEFLRGTPDPNSVHQEWVYVGRTLGQVALGQLAAVDFMSPDSVETRTHCSALMGKCLRLLAVQKDPLYPSVIWDRYKQGEDWWNSEAVSKKREDLGNGGERNRTDPRVLSAKSAELQRRRHRAKQLLAQASEMLAQAISLCLQHKLSSSILADACLNMLECHGQFDPAAVGQYLALFQSCGSAAMMAEVLTTACSDTSKSQFSALLSLHRNLLLSQEESPGGLLKETEYALSSLFKAHSHLTINPNHLSILGKLPPNLKILLLQHTDDGSELYGAFYENIKPSEKHTGEAGTLKCSKVAKVSVSPRALQALQQQTRAFSQETRLTLLKEARWHGNEGRLEAPLGRRDFPLKSIGKAKLESQFGDIVEGMESYLHPILLQLDFYLRHQFPSTTLPEPTKLREKEEKGGSEKVSSPIEPGENLVLLADRRLLELPLEALSVLQEEGLTSVSRDFSLQFLYSRLHREKPEKVESDNKKKTKGGKEAKGRRDQSKAIKVVPVSRVLPPYTFPVDTHNFKYIVDPYNEGNFEGTSLAEKMKSILETHSQYFTSLWDGFMGCKQTPSLAKMEQLLCKCGAFIYLGMERFMANIPPAKLAPLNLSGCWMALLFDLVQNNSSILRQTNLDLHKSAGELALERPVETVALLSLCGVRCIVLNQWHSSPQRNTHNMATVMDSLLRIGMTSGQAVHGLRKGAVHRSGRDKKATGSNDVVSLVGREGDRSSHDTQHKDSLSSAAFSCVLYGLPNLVVT
ncbi:cilia- and flagella-associated protein 46 [Lampris incognitus]|uniref:cilia- and flagella-associated protein 46 n=1 Tax=Lampris incognitus TaxID=2546036 RepID=UPI0024B61AF8|nr:cilia- and flagella-associated protein 46 [Lampris incognitus]